MHTAPPRRGRDRKGDFYEIAITAERKREKKKEEIGACLLGYSTHDCVLFRLSSRLAGGAHSSCCGWLAAAAAALHPALPLSSGSGLLGLFVRCGRERKRSGKSEIGRGCTGERKRA